LTFSPVKVRRSNNHDIGNDGVWDNWRLEGPSFVWNFRGKPHVHIWINVADDPKVELNAFQNSIM
jgi:hypothetical protein